jgi:hypothetical protein
MNLTLSKISLMKTIFIFVFLCAFQSSFAATYYFSSSIGDDSRSPAQAKNPLTPWKTINKFESLSVIKSGDSILFKKGDMWLGTTLVPNCDGIVFSNYGIGELPIIDGGTNLAINILRVYKSNLTFKGITFKRTKTVDIVAQLGNVWVDGDFGITHCTIDSCSFFGGVILQGSYNLFENNIVDGTNNDGNGNGIWEHHKQCHHNIYTGNNISHFTLRGIWTMIETHDCTFSNNTVHDCSLTAIDLDGAYYVVYAHKIVNNTIFNISNDAIELENAFDSTIQGNYLYGGGRSYIYVINYAKCEVVDGHGATNGIGALLNSTLCGNVMIGGGIDFSSVAIGIYKAGGVNVFNNSIYGFKSRFFNLEYASPAEVPMIRLVNNIFSNMEENSWYAMISFSTNDLNVLAEDDYNCFFNNGINDIYSDYKSYSLKSLAQYKAASGKAAHSIEINPLFMNVSDLHLQKNSPCIDAGKNVGLPFTGKSPDIGAYEYGCDPITKPLIQWYGKE